MLESLPTTPLVAAVAALAWVPGLVPDPFVVPQAESPVPSWVTPEDCSRTDRLAELVEDEPMDVHRVLACSRHRPGDVAHLHTAYRAAQATLADGDPDTAVDVLAWTGGLRQGSLVEQMVALSISGYVLDLLEHADPAAWDHPERLGEALALQAPLTLNGERYAVRTLGSAALEAGDLRSLAFAPALRWETDRRARTLSQALAAPADERLGRLDAALESPAGWARLGPAALLFQGGRAAWWSRTTGGFLRSAVASDLAQRARGRALLARHERQGPDL